MEQLLASRVDACVWGMGSLCSHIFSQIATKGNYAVEFVQVEP